VRAAALPFEARSGWILAFCVIVALSVIGDVLQQSWWRVLIDLAVAASLVSLWRSLQRFRRAAQLGGLSDFHGGAEDFARYVRLNVVLGILFLVGGVLVLLGLFLFGAALLHSGSALGVNP
jgi:hypothetical protein